MRLNHARGFGWPFGWRALASLVAGVACKLAASLKTPVEPSCVFGGGGEDEEREEQEERAERGEDEEDEEGEEGEEDEEDELGGQTRSETADDNASRRAHKLLIVYGAMAEYNVYARRISTCVSERQSAEQRQPSSRPTKTAFSLARLAISTHQPNQDHPSLD